METPGHIKSTTAHGKPRPFQEHDGVAKMSLVIVFEVPLSNEGSEAELGSLQIDG